jgi:antitoxin (DNA-binding transcriptional repressor) of toxin-antitoxin stability system
MSTLAWIQAGEYIGARQLRERLAEVIKSKKPFFVTEHGKPVKAMIPYEELLELLEAAEELKDRFLVREVAQGRLEYRKGDFKPLSQLKKVLRGRA